MARLRVNGIEVEVDNGATVLDAAERAGAEVPTLCYLKEIGSITSCMVCVVKDLASGQMLPACSAKAAHGMEINTDGEEVRAARREILQMLLSEHVGDCEAPCSRICPAGLNIPRMLRYIAADNAEAAARLAKRDLIFPATLGCICSAPCEKGCRRALYDSPIAIRRLHREVGERLLTDGSVLDDRAPATGKTVAVVGAGIAGLSAAWMCLLKGHACCVYDKEEMACTSLRSVQEEQVSRNRSELILDLQELIEAEVNSIRDLGAELVFSCEVGRDISFGSVQAEFDAVILACGAAASGASFRGNSGSANVRLGNRTYTVQGDDMPVRAVAQGKAVAHRVDSFLRGFPSDATPRRFNSRIGSLRPEEIAPYACERLQRAGPSRSQVRLGNETKAADIEAGRCLHCDCLKPVSCRLRRYAEEYGIGPRVDRHMKRLPVEPIQRCKGAPQRAQSATDDVLFEPGKCIKCGICVAITQAAGKDLGLTFVGRGLTASVRAPFGEPLARGLGETALQCVRACPTGALAFLSEEETE